MKCRFSLRLLQILLIPIFLVLFSGCASNERESLPGATHQSSVPEYLIGPEDTLNVFVWGNADLSATIPVRPDGKITTPLVEDVQASGKTPTQLAREMELLLARFIKNPVVTVTVTNFVGRYSGQVRIIGQATTPQAIPYLKNMTLLDVMIEVGGLTEFAAGNRAQIVRKVYGKTQQFTVRLSDLIRDGDITANVDMAPGDVLIIPEAWF